ncbi:MAG: dTDP-4-dehydrorhamnose reductase [Lewinellaceae bacterium]|jgi:dTDP-4-dehydrorhamnose reductase|nr:dTDP-4-dehydrorhamnose reductase [Lewinellaceae bacterium]
MTILITGGLGQVGQCFRQLSAQYPQWRFVFVDLGDTDITNRRAVRALFESLGNDELKWCVNCAAWTAVDKAESEPQAARRINVKGAENLAEACAARGIPVVHLSTDYVYHNRQNTPFREDDPVSPKSVYARTKLAGDRAVLRTNPLSMVVRTSWVYSAFGNNFVKTMLRLGAERKTLNVVFDQIGTPTYAPDLAGAILQVIRKVGTREIPAADIHGVWHYSNEGVTSWYDFAHAIFELKKMDCRVHPITTADFPTPALRPPFSVLDKGKIKAAFNLEIPHWRESLIRCLKELG